MNATRAWLAVMSAALAFAAVAIEPPQPAAGAQGAPAQQEPAPEQQAPPTDAAPAEEKAQAPAEAEGEEELPPLPADTGPAAPPPQRFNPTEKVRADFPVSFPIDI